MPTNYTLFRRIGSIKTNASAQWTKFLQVGDLFLWDTPAGDITAGPLADTSTLLTLSTPLGVSVLAIFDAGWSSTVAQVSMFFQSPLTTTILAAAITGLADLSSQVANVVTFTTGQYLTNTSSQIRACGNSATAGLLYVVTKGWNDSRGK